jgi:hypothetical protein
VLLGIQTPGHTKLISNFGLVEEYLKTPLQPITALIETSLDTQPQTSDEIRSSKLSKNKKRAKAKANAETTPKQAE